MKKKFKALIIILVLILIGLYISYIYLYKYVKKVEIPSVISNEEVLKEEELLENFINEDLMNESGGIYTNYSNNKSEGDLTKGHDILSESQGMILNYYLYKNNEDAYKNVFNYIKNNMILKDGLISWRIENNIPSEVSAAIDDLRISRSLIIAGDEFNDLKYRYYGLKIANSIKKKLVTDNRLIDFNDGYGKSNVTTLCYLDLYGMNLLSLFDDSWNDIYIKSLEIIDNGFISNDIPLYKKFYDGSTLSYDSGENVDTLLSVLVILNKAEVNEDVSLSVNWLKNRLKEYGYISTTYNINTLEESKVESTSIYANLVQIAKVINDKDLYEMAMIKMKNFQVLNEDSKIYGSFGFEGSNEVYSYDNLNALLALRRKFNN
ncbi:glycosyl hydrolase family 8 [Clostridium nigeriense]|uniref:glycosyl hydrolase family 8 n=1 Tax=Clostridium nigeriense TaxID=1805470 RepID=UPI003D33C55D